MNQRDTKTLNALIRSFPDSIGQLLFPLLKTGVTQARVKQSAQKTTHGFSKGDWVYFDGTDWQLADRDSATTLAEGMISEVYSANEFEVATSGGVSGLTGLTAGAIYYLSSTAGTMTTTKPTSGLVQELGKAQTANFFKVNIQEAKDPTVGDNPIGGVIEWLTGTAPTGWFLCNGDTVGNAASGATHASADYETLFDIIKSVLPNAGTEVFANGDTVNLPNMKGRIAVGLDGADTDFDALGETGGAKTHVLVEAELAQHDHTVTDPGHVHTTTEPAHNHGLTHEAATIGAGAIDRPGAGAVSGTYNTENASTGLSIDSNTTGLTVDNAGSDTAHNNVQPYLAMNFIIKF